MKRLAVLLLCGGLALPVVSARAAPAGSVAPTEPRVVAGSTAEGRVETLVRSIHWQRSLDDALALAKKEGKLVFFMHVKGDLDGAT